MEPDSELDDFLVAVGVERLHELGDTYTAMAADGARERAKSCTDDSKVKGDAPLSTAWLVVDTHFEAGHFLPYHKGKCSNQHGHSYRVIATIYGVVDPYAGMVIDFGDVKRVVNQLDHTNLNDIIDSPTAENVAKWLLDGIPMCTKIELWEGLGGCHVVVQS